MKTTQWVSTHPYRTGDAKGMRYTVSQVRDEYGVTIEHGDPEGDGFRVRGASSVGTQYSDCATAQRAAESDWKGRQGKAPLRWQDDVNGGTQPVDGMDPANARTVGPDYIEKGATPHLAGSNVPEKPVSDPYTPSPIDPYKGSDEWTAAQRKHDGDEADTEG